MFYKPAEWQSKPVQRFTKIIDPKVIEQLRAIKACMYPDL